LAELICGDDHVVTSTFVFEGEGRVQEYAGGYEDYLRQTTAAGRPPGATQRPASASDQPTADKSQSPASGARLAKSSPRKKRTFNEDREFADLPRHIDALEREQEGLKARVAGPEFYQEGAASMHAVVARLEAIESELLAAYARWDELDSLSARV
jgi:ATP-binding cassette subfamily F protein uup